MASSYIVGQTAGGAEITVRTFGSAGSIGDLGVQTASSGSTGSAVPALASFGGMNVGGNLVGLTGTGTSLNVNLTNSSIPASVTWPTDTTNTGTITSTQNVAINTNAGGSARIAVTGTWTGTLVFEQTIDGTNWVSITCIPVPIASPTSSGATVVSTTANGQWELKVAGTRQVRVRGNSVATGTATITINVGQHNGYVIANVIDDGFISTGNSTTTPLGSGATFTGTSVDLQPYSSITTWVSSDVGSATNGLVFQFSPDNSTWFTVQQHTITAGQTPVHFLLGRRARYFRVLYTNGGSAQGSFTIQTYLQRVAVQQNVVSFMEPLYGHESGTLTRSVITGQRPDNTFGNVTVSDINALSVSGSGTSAVAASAWTSGTSVNAAVNVIAGDYTINTIAIGFTTTATITGGAITFEGSIDGTNWVGLVGINAATQVALTTAVWTITTGTLVFTFNVSGFNYFRYRLSNVITGTGTCTGSWLTQALATPNISTTINQSGAIKVTGDQGIPNTIGNAWPIGVTDGTRGPATVKAASTAAIGADLALVVAVSPNNSVAVTGTFWQATQPISAASLPLPTGAATETTLSALNTKIPSQGQSVMASSIPVAIASNQTAVPVSGTFWQATQPVSGSVTANIGTSGSLALDATLTGGTQKAIVRGGAKGATSAADVTSTANGADHQGLDVQIQNATLAVTQSGTWTINSITNSVAVTGTFWQATQPISASSLPLPTGAATETTLSAMSAKLPATLGQTTMAASMSVALASNQTAIPVTQSGTWNIGTLTSITNSVTVVGAATLTDAFANPTTNQLTGSFMMGWNGTTWDRVRTANTGRLQVDVVTGGGTNASVSTTGSAVPASATFIGMSQGGNLTALTGTSGNLNVNLTNASVAVTGTFWQATQPVSIAATVATTATGAFTPADAAANPTTAIGTESFSMVFNGTTWDRARGTAAGGTSVSGVKTNNNAAPGATNLGVLPAVANAAAQAWTEGNQTALSVDLTGNVRTKLQSTTGNISRVASSASSVTLLSANTARLGVCIYNESTAVLLVKYGATASTSSYTLRINANGYYEVPYGYTGRLDAIWVSANGAAQVTELV